MINPSNSPKPSRETESTKFDRRVIFPIVICVLLALLAFEINTLLPLFRPTAAPPPTPSSTSSEPKAVLLFPTDTPVSITTLTPTPTSLPSATQTQIIQSTETKKPIPFTINLTAAETAPNQFKLSWRITGPAKTTASLRIGTESIAIKRSDFSGMRELTISAETEIELSAKSGESEKSQRLLLSYTERNPKILKFIVRIENAAGQAAEKIAELIPDSRKTEAYVVQVYRANPLPQDTRLQIEWEVIDADTLTIDPISQGLLALAGASAYAAKESFNFNLTAISGTKRVDASIPIRIASPVSNAGSNVSSAAAARTPTPVRTKIDFFTANPTSLTEPGNTTIAWSVSGPTNHIRLLDGDGRIIGENLSQSGLRAIPISSNQTLMLQVETATGTLASVETIRYKPETSVGLLPTTLTLYDVYPNQPAYTVGDRLTFNAGFSNLRENHPLPTGSILVSDGVASCVISLPKDTCELLLRVDGARQFYLLYSGDRNYLSSSTSTILTIEPFTRKPVALTLSTIANQTVFHPGEKIRLNASLSPETATGTLFFTNTAQTCLVTLPKNTCEMTALDPGPMTVRVRYSGDTNHLDASTELDLVSSPVEPTATPAMIPTTLTILQLFPEKLAYETGDSIDIYANISNDAGDEGAYRNRIRVSDGIAECTFNPNITNHCALRLVQAGVTAITVSYPGDSSFSPSMASVSISVSGKPKIMTQTKILAVIPSKASFNLNETVTVTVGVEAEPSSGTNKKPTGTVAVQAGTESCLITLPIESSCALQLSDPNTVELTASYAGDDTFASSDADPLPLSLRQMAFELDLYPVKFESCTNPVIDKSEPIPAENHVVNEIPLTVFYPDERFQIGRGFYLNAAIELFTNIFPSGTSGGSFMAELCPDGLPDQCFTQTAPSQPVANDPNRQEALIYFPPTVYAGLYKLTLDFSANDPTVGRYRKTIHIDQIMPGTVFLQPEGASIDFTNGRIHWENIDASLDQDQNYTFFYNIIIDQDLRCTAPLTSVFPTPSFESIEVNVDASIPGAGSYDDTWRNAFRSQGVSEDILDQLQPNQSEWLSDRCGLSMVNQVHAVTCRRVGLTEPSSLTPNYGLFDPNYRTSPDVTLPIDVILRKSAAVILPSAAWKSVVTGDVYWLNANGTDFNYWAAPNCDDPTTHGYQTSATRIPDERKLGYTAKLLSRANSNALQLADADGFVSITPGTGSDWALLPTYHGICGSCTPKKMMDFDWIVNEGCESDGSAIRLTNPNGRLYNGQTCEYNQYAQVDIRSDFCQVRMGGADEFFFDLEETDSHLSAEARVSTSPSGRVAPVPFFQPDSSTDNPTDSLPTSLLSEPDPISLSPAPIPSANPSAETPTDSFPTSLPSDPDPVSQAPDSTIGNTAEHTVDSVFSESFSDDDAESGEPLTILEELAAQLEEIVEPTDLIVRERYGEALFDSFWVALPNNPPAETFIADENNSVRFLDRTLFAETQRFFFDVESQSESVRNCATPPDGFTLDFELELTSGVMIAEFPCDAPSQFSEPLICEIDFQSMGIDPEEVLSLSGMTLRFAGNECFNEFDFPLDFESHTVARITTTETTATEDGFEVWLTDDPDRSSLTLYCCQPGVELICAGSCWGMDIALPLEDEGSVFVPAIDAVYPSCYAVSMDEDRRVTIGVP